MNERVDFLRDVMIAVGSALGAWVLQTAGHPIVKLTLMAAAADFISGYAKACILGRVESNRLGKGFYKLFAYLGVALGLVWIGQLDEAARLAANGLAAAFFFRELLSNVENLHVIGLRLRAPIPGIALLVKLLRLNQEKLLAEAQPPTIPDDRT